MPEAPPVPKASTFIGSSIVNTQGESLGKLDDLVLDPATGSITYAVLSRGSVLGLGGKLYAVAWEALKLQPDGKTFVLNVSPETLENSPGFDKNNWPQRPDPMLSAAVRGTGAGTAPSPTPPATGTPPVLGTATGTAISAVVQAVNAPAETVTLKTQQGESMELRAPTTMLEGLQAGDLVEVKMAGTQATDIRKKN
jgi:sporulation protein YlmC with PRC-barrel domain